MTENINVYAVMTIIYCQSKGKWKKEITLCIMCFESEFIGCDMYLELINDIQIFHDNS